MAQLSAQDEELLELVALKVPWHMVCGDFHERFGSPGALARRLLELRSAGFLTITPNSPGTTRTAEALEEDALDNDCYEDVEFDAEATWSIFITQTGLEAISGRLKAQ